MRINRYLSAYGVCSRREADRKVERGEVNVNGKRAFLGQNIVEGDSVCINGVPIKSRGREVYLAVNKPRGVVVTTDHTFGDTTLNDIVKYPVRVFAVGRLDKESEGLVLMTNNGMVSNEIQRSRGCHEKEYIVTVDHPLTTDFLRRIASGVRLKELSRTTRPCKIRRIGACRFDIILTEGMNRQIRRMCLLYGYKVRALKRTRIMNITLGDLPSGKYRELTGPEEARLKLDLKMPQMHSF